MFTKESTNRAVVDFKIALNEAIGFAGEKQEMLALKLGVTQGQINNWLSPNSDRNFPMALFHLLPVRMQCSLMEYLDNQCDSRTKFNHLTGCFDKKIIELITLECELINQVGTNPASAKKTIAKMRETLDHAELECDSLTQLV